MIALCTKLCQDSNCPCACHLRVLKLNLRLRVRLIIRLTSKLSHNRAYSSLLVVLLATLLLSGLFFMSLSVFSVQSAFALTTNKTTAKSNQTEGNGVIGGKETRLTWEGTVEDEQVSQLTLQLPEGSDLQSATTR